MQRWLILAPSLGHDPQLVVGYRLEQRLREQAKALDFFPGQARSLGLVILTHGVHSLLNERLTSLNHSDESSLLHDHPQHFDRTSIVIGTL